ncbi:MAG: hypothetical protein IT444_11255 [Phycisphaeraceae bacterium]|nr:hypothetical protein [Phycisphaeraceae bacterium]
MLWTIQSWYEAAFRETVPIAAVVREHADQYLQSIQDELQVPREEAVRLLRNFNRARLAARPSLTKYPELRGVRELVEARWRGQRDGAQLDEARWESYCGGWLFLVREVAAGRGLTWGRNECSMVFFPTSDAGPICAKNWDVNADAVITPPYWPICNEFLIFDGVSCNLPCDEVSPELFPVPMEALVARYCRTAAEAVEMLERYNDFWGPGNRMVIDRDLRVAEIEKTTRKMKVRWKPDGFGFVTGMAVEDPELQAHAKTCRENSRLMRGLPPVCADTAYWAAQDPRRELMRQLLDEAKRAPTVEAMRDLLQYRGPRGKVAGDGDILLPGGPPAEHTVRTQIWLLREGRAKWWKRDHARNIPSWKNPQPDVVYENVWTWN